MGNSSSSRCVICDFTTWGGSEFASKAPNPHNKVLLRHNGEVLCDECYYEIVETIVDYEEDDTTEDPSTLP